MPPHRPLSIFISYTREDAEHARNLYQHLADFRSRDGATVFFDQQRIQPGYRWRDAIQQALEQSDLFVLLLSRGFLNSDFCLDKEARHALDRVAKGTGRIFVVQIGDCTYDNLPPDAPGGRYLGEAARQTAADRLNDLQAAGPFDPAGRLIAMNALSASAQDTAWRDIVDRSYQHFGLPRHARPQHGAGAEPTALPDADVLVAHCDRQKLVEKIGELAGRPQPALLAVTGHRMHKWLFSRIGKDLEAPPHGIANATVYFNKMGECTAPQDYDRHLVGHVNCVGVDDPPRSAEAVLAWASQSGRRLLLVGHAVDAASMGQRLSQARRALQAASDWLRQRRSDQLQIVVVVGIESPAHAQAGWSGMLRYWLKRDLHTQLQRQLAELADQAGVPALGHAVHPMSDYLPGEVTDWLSQPEVNHAFSRNRALYSELLDQLKLQLPLDPVDLLQLCNRLHTAPSQPPASTPR